MNDPQSLSGKVLSADEEPKLARFENVKSVGNKGARTEYIKFDAVSMQVARNISPRKSLLWTTGKHMPSIRLVSGKNDTSIAKFLFQRNV